VYELTVLSGVRFFNSSSCSNLRSRSSVPTLLSKTPCKIQCRTRKKSVERTRMRESEAHRFCEKIPTESKGSRGAACFSSLGATLETQHWAQERGRQEPIQDECVQTWPVHRGGACFETFDEGDDTRTARIRRSLTARGVPRGRIAFVRRASDNVIRARRLTLMHLRF